MKTRANLLCVGVGILLAAAANGFSQPVITCQPQNQTNVAGTTATFSVCATGTPPLSYQWRSHASGTVFTNIPWGTDATLLLTNVQPTTRRFGVVVSDAIGSATSVLATLTVLVPPTITNQPTSQTVEVGESATFSVGASGTAPLRYQWRRNDAELAGKTNTSLVLTNLQLTNAENYSVVVTNIAGSTNSQIATLTVLPPVFTKITNGSIVTDVGSSFACAWADYDDDGHLDLFVTRLDYQTNLLYNNNRNGTFTRITQGEIVNTPRDYRGIAWGDYDNDGHLDVFVSSNDGHGFPPWNYLYRNNGNGTFTSMPSNVVGSLVGPNGTSEGCTWADYDRDGFLDLFVARYANDQLFHNNGDGAFTPITNSPVVQDGRNEYQGAWSDYDNDGWPDLFMSGIDAGTNFLYHNNGDGTLTRITSGDIATNTVAHRPAPAWVDYNNDGLPDLFVGAGDFGPNLLYRNDGNGIFTKITTGDLITLSGRSPQWGDYDNDGFVDAFLPRLGLDNLLYHNNGDGTFTRITTGIVVHDGGNSYHGGWGDYDNDGFLDLFVTNNGEKNFLYRNNGNSNQWLKVKLVGTVSNRSAIGAKVRVNATIRGKNMWQLRELSDGSGFGGTMLIAHFGLADATNIDTVRIEWPSGTVQDFHDVRSNQLLTIIEPPHLTALRRSTNGPFQMQLTCWPGFDFAIEASSNLIDWTPWTTVTTTNRITRIEDPSAVTREQRFYRAVHP